uniref:RRM domain-containing protein n=1 Tax=Clytia hemisphaerica TaxID=252671 RepID=A0A7M5VE87_9CNID
MAAPGYGSRQQMHGNRGNNFNNGRFDSNQGNFRNHGNGNDHFRNDGNRRNFTNNGDPFRNNSDPYRDNEGRQGNINDPFREDNNKEHYSNHENFINDSDPYRNDGNQGNFHGNQTGNYGQEHDNRFVNTNEGHFNAQRENNFGGEDDFCHPKLRGGGRVSPRLDKPEHRSYDEVVGRDYNSRSPDRRQERRRGDYDRDYSSRRRRSRTRSRSRERNSSRSSRNRSRSRERRRERSPGYRHERDDSRDRRASRYEREGRDNGDNNRESEYRRSLASSSTSLSRDDRYHRDDHSRTGNVAGTTSSTSKFDLIQPSPTVIIQSLHLEAQEKDIEAILKEDGFVAKNVSVIRERNSESRGFAFVDFDNENMARDWIIKRQQKLVILGQRSVLNYSRNKKQQQPNQQQQPTHVADWTCNKCNGLNFGSRHKFGEPFVCFKCNTIRDESDVQRQDQHQQNKDSSVCANPCNVLMIRGMDFSTEEEKIRMEVVKLTSKVLYDVRLIRDKITDMSRGFAFIELGTTEVFLF